MSRISAELVHPKPQNPFHKLFLAYHTSVRVRFMTIIGLAILLPLLALAIWSFTFISKGQLETAYAHQIQQLAYVDLWINAQLNDHQKQIMKLIASQPAVLEADSSIRTYVDLPAPKAISPTEYALQQTFTLIKDAYPDVAFIFLGLENGSYIESPQFQPQKPYDPTKRPWYLNTQKQEGIKVGNPYYTSVTNQLVVSVTQPITTRTALKGVVGFTMEIESLTNMVHKNKNLQKEHMILINPEGVIVVSPIAKDWVSKPITEVLPVHLHTPFISESTTINSKIVKDRFYDFTYPSQSTLYSAIIQKLPNSDWKIISLIDKKSLYSDTVLIMTYYIAAFMATICVSLLLIWRYIGLFTKPLESIGKTITSENYLHPDGLEEIKAYNSQLDEIGLIAKAVLQLINSRQQIADSQERLTITTQLTTQAYWDYSTEEQLLYLNPSMALLVDAPNQMSLINFDVIWSKVLPIHVDMLKDAINSILAGEATNIEVAIQIRETDNQDKWYLARAEGLTHANQSTPYRIIGVLIDIDYQRQQLSSLASSNATLENLVAIRTTELTALNQELIATNEDLDSALQYIRDTQEETLRTEKLHTMSILVSGVAHEVNTPLGISITLATYLIEQSTAILKNFRNEKLSRSDFVDFLEQTTESLNMLHINLERTASLIESLKILNKANRLDEATPYSVADTLSDILISLKPTLEKNHITISTLVNVNKHFIGVQQHFHQIIANLLINSVRHAFDDMQSSAHIAIRIDLDNNDLKIKYSDNGSGIPEAIIKHIFDPFFTTKRGNGGTGLGLYLVYNLVTISSRGSITYSPIHPHGSQFDIVLKSSNPY